MTTDTAPTTIVRPAAQHRRRPDLPLWIRLTRPLLVAAIAGCVAIAIGSLAMLVVAVLGVAIAALGR